MVDKVSFKVLKMWLLNLFKYRFNIVWYYILFYGRGVIVFLVENKRMKVLLL